MSLNHCLKIGSRLLCGDQVISALVEYKIFEKLIEQVILDEAIEKISLSHREIFEALVGSDNTAIPEDFEEFLAKWCQERNVTWDYLNRVILRELRVEKFKQSSFSDQVRPEFLRTKLDLDQVEYSRIQVSDPALAQELYFQIRDDGADFFHLARQHSLGDEQHMGGWVEPTSLASLPPEVTHLFRTGKAGTVYGPITVGDRYWIVRLERMAAARLTTSTRNHLIERLYRQWIQAQLKALISQPGAIMLQAAS